ncbi:HEAT repeat domain-containing protein [Roseiconus nitratireducens]|uniref:HEAT repeat domain-containing protein n=1 Tax=Roseiconus nitratireducens TaxID=2605748 RepID=A0A5M6D9Y4_9BACT|nr:HEAT repeat domain-containing protein [Roseiconus nitratireducens]KAA5543092.1 HEAT repeat domain-containing protein [Roseiconus nitratireducens]
MSEPLLRRLANEGPRQLRTAFRVGCALGISLAGAAVAVHADTVELRSGVSGAEIDGEIVRRVDEGRPPHLVLQVDSDLRIAVPQTRVRKSIADEELEKYRAAALAADDDAEAHYQLARACKKNGLDGQCDYHFRRAIELDPDHGPARAALGYVRNGNDWILYADQQRKRGMIRVAGRWTVPEAHLREERQEQIEVQAKQWVRDFARLRTTVLKGGKAAPDALAEIKAIDDPTASTAFAEALLDSRGGPDSQSMRMTYVEKLGSFRTSVALQALVKAGLEEPDAAIRDYALEQLQSYGGASAVATYLPILSAESHTPAQVHAALRALQPFPQPALWRQYVDALITTHKTRISKGPGIQTGMSSLGGGGLTMGGKDEVRVEQVRNPGALELLKTIAPGADFQYDQNAWRQYFAAQLMQSPGDLRRDP